MSQSKPSAELEVKAIQERLVNALSDHTQQPFYCSGKLKVTSNDLILYYGEEEKASRIDLSGPNENQVKALADACTKASFGMNQQDILDETYRKAGKIDNNHFALNFNPVATGLLERVRGELLGLQFEVPNIRAELYKLNVYGPGSFFKSHVDTPRGKEMFGSLVVVLPTSHEGGALHLRHSGKAFVYDSARELSSKAEGPSIGYAAFYSDVEHEVMEVTSGYRITLTYNLYFDRTNPRPQTPIRDETVSSILSELLSQPTFVPKGGLVGFGLTHKYPISTPARERLRPLLDCLKGADAALLAVLRHHGFDPLLYAVYDIEDAVVISETVLNLQNINMSYDDNPVEEALNGGGLLIERDDSEYQESKKVHPVKWIMPTKRINVLDTFYLAYGNDASIEHVYGDIALIFRVGKPGARMDTAQGEEEGGEDEDGDEEEEDAMSY
ncbi:hypothetical protein BOTBODRAFT_32412 [Botryobasidium botryosum FD-172 SS1]|uniref:Fe2OG dioxygenase domain-containing protein n=1 Tax=Botryobasidium botryosum (strain FD-172 SS1) TaxID=930990 RepID=A0A067MGK5_BOTB1|nr:hypothetical protein BOTBODRAFT_32412 [Botryobasidium botryosum FD-172 SS1]